LEGSRVRAVLHGGARGVVGAMAMTGMRVLTTELGLVEETPPEAIGRQPAERPFDQQAASVAKPLLTRASSSRSKRAPAPGQSFQDHLDRRPARGSAGIVCGDYVQVRVCRTAQAEEVRSTFPPRVIGATSSR
jgi:hypothetical protein